MKLLPITLIELPIHDRAHIEAATQAEALLKLHTQVRQNIIQANNRYIKKVDGSFKDKRQFNVGDLVWIHLRKDRFPNLRKNKLLPKAVGPFLITAKMGDNAYSVALPEAYGVSSTFNIGDLAPYYGPQELGSIISIEGGNETYRRATQHEELLHDNTTTQTHEDLEELHNLTPEATEGNTDFSILMTKAIEAITKENPSEEGITDRG